MTDTSFQDPLRRVSAASRKAALEGALARESIEINLVDGRVILSVGGRRAALAPIEARVLANRLAEEAVRADKEQAEHILEDRLRRVQEGELPTFCPACGRDAYYISSLKCFIHTDTDRSANEVCWEKGDAGLIQDTARYAARDRAHGRDAVVELPGERS